MGLMLLLLGSVIFDVILDLTDTVADIMMMMIGILLNVDDKEDDAFVEVFEDEVRLSFGLKFREGGGR